MTIQPEAEIRFVTVLRAGKADFYLQVPTDAAGVWERRAMLAWDGVRLVPEEIPETQEPYRLSVCQGRDRVLALDIGGNDFRPLAGVLNCVQALGENDFLSLTVTLRAADQAWWEINASQRYREILKGTRKAEMPPLSARALEAIDQTLLAVAYVSSPKQKPEERMRGLYAATLSKWSRAKPWATVVKATVEIAASSSSQALAKVHARELASALRELDGDQTLVTRPVGSALSIASRLVGGPSSEMVLTTEEAARLLKLPGTDLIEAFPEVRGDAQRHVRLPDALFTKGGIPLGYVMEGGHEDLACIPTSDADVLCLPHVALGAMGVGKTRGQGGNTALGMLRAGYSAFVIDVADGALIDTVRDALPGSFPEDHILDLDFGDTENPIPLDWHELAGRDLRGAGRKIANQLAAQLTNFLNQMSVTQTSDRMERYLTASARGVLSLPDASLLEVVRCLTDDAYRAQIVERSDLGARARETLRTLGNLTDGARTQVIQPILDRLDVILGDEALSNVLLQRPKMEARLDFRRWADGDDRGPYCVGLRVPKSELMADTTDRLVAFLIAKLWLAILSRYDVPEGERRPCAFVMDEPHQFMSSKELWSDMVREARKWRLKLLWLAHDFRDFGTLGKTMKDSGCQWSVYRSSKETYKDLLEELAPFELEELLALPPRHHAANRVILPGETPPAFVARMAPPPKAVKDRSGLRAVCSRKYGRPVAQVEKDIMEREGMIR